MASNEDHGVRSYGLGVRSLIDPSDSRRKIVEACVKCWFQSNPSGHKNSNDCSGFLKAVQIELGLTPFNGNANGIYAEVTQAEGWEYIGEGIKSIKEAGEAANSGHFVVSVYQNETGNGHVMIITTYLKIFGSTEAQRAIGNWGQIGKDKSGNNLQGDLGGQLSKSFGSNKHPKLLFSKYKNLIA